MKRTWAVLAVLAVAAIVAILVLGPSKRGPVGGVETAGDRPAADSAPPALAPSGNGGGMAGGAARVVPAAGADGMEDEGAKGDEVQIVGTVVDDATGKPVAGARVVAEITTVPCPPFPHLLANLWSKGAAPRLAPRAPGDLAFLPDALPATTDDDGAFAVLWRWATTAADVFVRAPGYVVASQCAVLPKTPTTIRLKRGLEIRGVVVRPDGAAIENAVVRAEPAPGTPILPGHADATTTDKEGKFALTGLVPGSLVVSADHPKYVPSALDPMEPGINDVRIVLVPAFLATFNLKPDDGKEPDAPTLAWKTTGSPPRTGLQILTHPPALRGVDVPPAPPMADGDAANADVLPDGVWAYDPVRIPCDRPEVTFEVKAIGCEVWTSDPEPLPPEGGEKTYEVGLRRDMTLGSLKISFEDPDHNPVSFVKDKCEVVTGRHDQVPIPAGIVIRPSDVLEFPALPGGPYDFLVRSPLHAPLVLQVNVGAARENEARGVLGPPAKLRVRFTAPQATVVRFRLMMGRNADYPFPEGSLVAQEGDAKPGDEPKDPVFHAGAEGLLLSGLSEGRHTVEVLSPELVAPPTPVDLVAGETREIEIAVQMR